MVIGGANSLEALKAEWLSKWSAALACWSRFVQLCEPRWCLSKEDEQRQQLSGSFAMIRLVDHAVVISLRQIHEQNLEAFAVEILAHEIGHHVYCPADLSDNARILTRVRSGLPTRETFAPLIANLYTDLLINDRLQRSSSLDLAGVFRKLPGQSQGRLWTLYMRIYEVLWKLQRAELAKGRIDQRLDYDAQLGARLIRSYAKEWLEGSGRFAALCLPYLLEDSADKPEAMSTTWHDTKSAGQGGAPDGLTEIEEAEQAGAVHPSEDPDLSEVEAEDAEAATTPAGQSSSGKIDPKQSGRKSMKQYRGPREYTEVLRATGSELHERQIIARYYRERAVPHLIRFPAREQPQATDPLPEGLEVWDVGSPVEDVDWLGSVQASPLVVPGITTRQRVTGTSPGTTPQALPVDLYLGVDCSGSTAAHTAAYPAGVSPAVAMDCWPRSHIRRSSEVTHGMKARK